MVETRKAGGNRAEDQLKDPIAKGIQQATADILGGLLKKGFLAGVTPIDGDDPEKPEHSGGA